MTSNLWAGLHVAVSVGAVSIVRPERTWTLQVHLHGPLDQSNQSFTRCHWLSTARPGKPVLHTLPRVSNSTLQLKRLKYKINQNLIHSLCIDQDRFVA